MNDDIAISIKGYEGFYEIDRYGNIFGVERKIKLSNGKTRKIMGRLLSHKNNGSGYFFVRLSKKGSQESLYVHRLLASTFIDNPENLKYVNHIDGDPSNNDLANLEWVSHAQNVKHGYDNCLNGNQKGQHHMAVGVVDNILGKEFATIKEWCIERKINYSTGRNTLLKISKTDYTETVKISKKIENGN
jgi:hypothetical protein